MAITRHTLCFSFIRLRDDDIVVLYTFGLYVIVRCLLWLFWQTIFKSVNNAYGVVLQP